MNILFVVPYVPSLIRVRPYNLIRYLAGRGHRITLLTLWSSPQEEEELKELERSCFQIKALHLPRSRSMWNSLAVLPTRQPLQSAYCWHPGLAEAALSFTHRTAPDDHIDLVHVEHLRGVRYGLHLKSAAARTGMPAPPVVWDSVDSISLLFRQAASRSSRRFSRWLTRLELGRTEGYEGWLLSQFERVTVTSQADRQALLALSPQAEQVEGRVRVLPNGVDLDYFSLDGKVERDPSTLVISGKMSYHANVSMALHLVRDIMPLVWKERPEVKVQVVGKDPPREILALAENPSVEITGTVRDIRPYLRRAAVAAVPITYGAGIQNKVLEAMACGTPVVSTPQSASALQAVAGKDLLVADDPAAFAAAVLCLLDNPERRTAVGNAGRLYVEAHHHWDTIASRLEETYQEALLEQRSSISSNAKILESW
jgi:polysaccharide biosynthesis protein PslH